MLRSIFTFGSDVLVLWLQNVFVCDGDGVV